MSYEKVLPRSTTWLFLNRLADNLTDLELQSFLANHGIHLPLENISVRNFPSGKSAAKIAVPNYIVEDLVNRALLGIASRPSSEGGGDPVRRTHARRPRYALPFGLNLADFDFVPTREEKLLDRVYKMKADWDREDDARRRLRSKQVAAEIEEAKRKQAIEDRREESAREREAEIERRRNYYLSARKTEDPLVAKLVEKYLDELDGGWRKKALAKLAKIEREIKRDAAKAERKALLEKGVLRVRRR